MAKPTITEMIAAEQRRLDAQYPTVAPEPAPIARTAVEKYAENHRRTCRWMMVQAVGSCYYHGIHVLDMPLCETCGARYCPECTHPCAEAK